ncbi:hypothetical protein CMUS01_10439 [Colletotrichum musicola]|uniref:Uncharacterized protein n=1 Tax=Colletotrichum musicola TaxID=2175873 RepID=A0A8H6N8D0_9PEZI|nr:hypothetical protein CMUS01_10439 [Colletotrichum musicola]
MYKVVRTRPGATAWRVGEGVGAMQCRLLLVVLMVVMVLGATPERCMERSLEGEEDEVKGGGVGGDEEEEEGDCTALTALSCCSAVRRGRGGATQRPPGDSANAGASVGW